MRYILIIVAVLIVGCKTNPTSTMNNPSQSDTMIYHGTTTTYISDGIDPYAIVYFAPSPITIIARRVDNVFTFPSILRTRYSDYEFTPTFLDGDGLKVYRDSKNTSVGFSIKSDNDGFKYIWRDYVGFVFDEHHLRFVDSAGAPGKIDGQPVRRLSEVHDATR